METILLFFLKKVCHILLTNSSLELISTYLHLSVAQMLKPSKFMAQLHYNKWSDAADCFTFFEIFSCKIGAPHVSSCSGIKVTEGFSIISNLVVTTRITISYSRANFFWSSSLNKNSLLSLHLDLKITSSLQNSYVLSIFPVTLVL